MSAIDAAPALFAPLNTSFPFAANHFRLRPKFARHLLELQLNYLNLSERNTPRVFGLSGMRYIGEIDCNVAKPA